MIESPASVVAPRGAEPRQSWSLLEMLRFYAMSFTGAVGNLERSISAIMLEDFAADKGIGLDVGAAAGVRMTLAAFAKQMGALPVSKTVIKQAERVTEQIATNELTNEAQRSVALTLLHELKLNVVNDLAAHLCLMVPDKHRSLFEQKAPLFGTRVADRFPDAGRDIAAAGRCLALDEWTAAVFHLMRVVEHGLRDLADRVGATFPVAIELENWKNIIDAIEKRIRSVEQQPKSLDKTADLQFYGIAASQFWHFKEAWRNHVSHSREHYDEREAMQVYNAVGDFMQKIAERA